MYFYFIRTVVLAACLLVTGSGQAAAAADMIRGIGSGLCLTTAGYSTANGVAVVTWDCKDRPTSHWEFVPSENGAGFQIKNKGSGFCLAVGGVDKMTYQDIVQYTCVDTPWNQWKWVEKEGGRRAIQGVGSGLCIAVAEVFKEKMGNKIVTYDCNNADWEQWDLVDGEDRISGVAAIPNGEDVMIKGVDSGLCLTIASYSNAPVAGVVTWDCNDRPTTHWRFLEPTPNSKGGQIQNLGSGLCLAVAGENKMTYNNIVQYNCLDTPWTQWRWVDKGAAGKMIQGVGSGMCFAVTGVNKLAMGTQIVTYDCNNAGYEQWNARGWGGNTTGIAPAPAPAPAPIPSTPPPLGPAGPGDCPYRPLIRAEYNLLNGYDITPGRNLAVRSAPSFEECGRGCLICKDCVAVVYNQLDGTCYLKDSNNVAGVTDPYLVAGVFNM